MTALTFEFTVSPGPVQPNIRFKIDGQEQTNFQLPVGTTSVRLPLYVEAGAHTLEIERYNKLYEHGDQSVTLDNIYIEDVRLPDWVKSSGKFYYDDVVVESGLTWYPNGRYILPVQTPLINWIVDERINRWGEIPSLYAPTPLINWIVDERINRWGEIPSLYAPTPAKRQQLTEILNNFEQALQDVKV